MPSPRVLATFLALVAFVLVGFPGCLGTRAPAVPEETEKREVPLETEDAPEELERREAPEETARKVVPEECDEDEAWDVAEPEVRLVGVRLVRLKGGQLAAFRDEWKEHLKKLIKPLWKESPDRTLTEEDWEAILRKLSGLPEEWGPILRELLVWRELESSQHPLLRRGVEIVTLVNREIIPSLERRVVLEKDVAYEVWGPKGLARFLRKIRSAKDALAYFELLRSLLPSKDPLDRHLGLPLRPAAKRLYELGEYGRDDAARWRVAFKPKVSEKEGVFSLRRPTLIHGKTPAEEEEHPDRPGSWFVVLLEERVDRDGAHSARVLRVLDRDGRRFQLERL